MTNRIADYLPAWWKAEHAAGRPERPPPPPAGPGAASWLEPVVEIVKSHPGAALAAAFCVGVTVAWWIKRR